MSSVPTSSRFRRASPCPICQGYDDTPRGKGQRCHGFLSADGDYAHCAREEYAGSLPQEPNSQTYAHKLTGDCRCGIRHDPSIGDSRQPSTNGHGHRRIVATYDYKDEQNQLLYQVVRYEPKGFSQRRPDGRGGWIWSTTGVRRVLYKMTSVVDTVMSPKGVICIAEGEEDVHALRSHGYVATCNDGGAKKWTDAHSAYLKGAKDVVIFGDNDDAGRAHVAMVVQSLRRVGIQARVAELDGLPPKGDVRDWLKDHGQDDLDRVVAAARHQDHVQPDDGDQNPWEHIKSAPVFLAEPETPFEGLAKDLLAPGVITLISAPKGLGKTQVALNLGVALATGGVFRGEVVKPVRVLVLDRDNPESVLKQRLRNWGATTADNLHVLTRRHAPDLKDREAWARFPLESYDVLVIDAVGSFTEGITEKEGRLTTEVLATLLDLARRGIAILLLNNVTKDGANFKGREEWADRVDIMYEVRDATGFTPSGKRDWWVDLPPSGEASWAERAQRRKGAVSFRLGFIPSKFRLGPEPEPFCLELNLPPEGLWTLKDVTESLIAAGQEAVQAATDAKNAQREAAVHALAERLTHSPINKTDAEAWLREEGIGRNEARQMVQQYAGILWTISAGEGKGAPQVLFPMGGGENNHTGEPLGDKELPGWHFRRLGALGGANGASAEPLPERPAGQDIFSAGGSRTRTPEAKEGWLFGRRGGTS